eukprot:scaffold4868_cov416-Prasinococcus_capsulatus_cf.AAC.8
MPILGGPARASQGPTPPVNRASPWSESSSGARLWGPPGSPAPPPHGGRLASNGGGASSDGACGLMMGPSAPTCE